MLKSRSSTRFTSQLKDFIAPVAIDHQNCGNVIIHKQTDPDEDPNTTEFGYTKSFDTDPATPNTFTLTDDGVETSDNVLFGTGYTVTEDVIPAGWEFVSVDCIAVRGDTHVDQRRDGDLRHRQRSRRPRLHLHQQGTRHDRRREDHG